MVGKWEAVRAALTSAAEDVLGTITWCQPDRFQESLSQLRPLLDHRNEAYARWLGSGRQVDLTRFREARGEARRVVRKAKNAWFLEKRGSKERAVWREEGVEVYLGHAARQERLASL